MKNFAVVGLVRGYQGKIENYDSLLKRNRSIYEQIGKSSNFSYDMILFHESSLIDSDKTYIQSNSPEDINFINVDKSFEINHSNLDIDKEDLKRFNIGYRLMCRFNSLYIWDFVRNYDYILRADEDVEFLKIEDNIFRNMEKNNKIFKSVKYIPETHKITNETLPNFIKEQLNLNNIDFYNHKFPYTNVYISSVKFWLKENINSNLKKVVENENQLIFRWGDLPIIGSFLNIYLKKEQFGYFMNTSYRHDSHNQIVKSKSKFKIW